MRMPLSHLRFLGWKRHCPICGFRARKFLSAGHANRSDALCPWCGSLERHRLVWLFLERCTNFFHDPPARMLHIAPEVVLAKRLSDIVGPGYLTGDLSGVGVDVQLDITVIQFPENTFDLLYCSHVLEHVPDDQLAMRECLRVLKPGAFAILLVPITVEKTIEDPSVTDPRMRFERFGQEDHVRRYGPDYKDRLEKAGFRVEHIPPETFLSEHEISRMAITSAAGDVYLCKK